MAIVAGEAGTSQHDVLCPRRHGWIYEVFPRLQIEGYADALFIGAERDGAMEQR